MKVIKRDGESEEVSFDKIIRRVKNLSNNLNVDPIKVAQRVIESIFDGITTTELDELSAETSCSLSTEHPDYGMLAGRVSISNHQKNTPKSFYRAMKILYDFTDKNNKNSPLIAKDFFEIVKKHKKELEDTIDYERDFYYDYFGFKTLQRSYLMKVNKEPVERIQHMWMRVALGIHGEDVKSAIETYHLMSNKNFTHATPTLYNSGTPRPQLSSCFLIPMSGGKDKDGDSIDGILSTLKQCGSISKWAGGIGLHIHNVRAKGSHIRGTNGVSNGIVPMLKMYNNAAVYIDQCFTEDTLIYTNNGVKKIKDIIVNEDKVVTIDGKYKNVFDKKKFTVDTNNEYKLYEIKTKHGIISNTVTSEHPFYILKNQKRMTNYSIIKNRLDKNLIKPEWELVKNITKDDLICYPIPNYFNDNENINEEDCFIYGILLGDGSLSRNTFTAHLNNSTKLGLLDWIKSYLEKLDIKYYTTKYDNTIRISWSSLKYNKINYNDLYNNREKYISSKFIDLPINKVKYIIKGLLQTDGSIDNEILLELSSKILIYQVRYILLKMSILTSGYLRNRIGNISTYKNITTKKETICLRIPKVKEICELLNIEYNDKSFLQQFKYKNHIYSRINSIKSFDNIKDNIDVYDLRVEDNHNYLLVNSGLAHNGGGRRKGSWAIYLEPWHGDIEDFLELRKNHGDESKIARDLFYALWIPDLFMKRVEEEGVWSLMCPDICKGLSDSYGEEFEELYTKYENEGKYIKQISARKLWYQICEAQIETGTPYILYKDAANRKSNHQNLGTIKSSNLCTEIMEFTAPDEIAVCNLASINLRSFVEDDKYNFDKLHETTKTITRNLNKIIDVNYYPVEEAKTSNKRHRPIGIGVQGLADTFCLLSHPFDSQGAKDLNKDIFETIYHASMEASCELSQERESEILEYKQLTTIDIKSKEIKKQISNILKKTNFSEEELTRKDFCGTYDSYLWNGGCPVSKGIFQYDMWNVTPSTRWNWKELKENVTKYGVRNSLLVAPMPTAGTSQILGNCECFEPFTSNMFTRRTLAGEFMIINKYLMRDLIKLDLWNEEMRRKIMAHEGSIQNLEEIPQNTKDLYKTVWEIKQKNIIDMAADRGAYIDQSQSMNLFIANPSISILTSMQFYAWKKGLKTGQYYLRTKPVARAQQFTVDPTMAKTRSLNINDPNSNNNMNSPVLRSVPEPKKQIKACLRDNPECESCGA